MRAVLLHTVTVPLCITIAALTEQCRKLQHNQLIYKMAGMECKFGRSRLSEGCAVKKF